jgi:hypothetical protein
MALQSMTSVCQESAGLNILVDENWKIIKIITVKLRYNAVSNIAHTITRTAIPSDTLCRIIGLKL